MVRSNREGVGMERWEKYDQAELNYLARYQGDEWNAQTYLRKGNEPDNSFSCSFAVGEVVRIKGQKGKELGVIGVVIRPFEYTGLYVAFPQHDTPQLVPAKWMEKVNED